MPCDLGLGFDIVVLQRRAVLYLDAIGLSPQRLELRPACRRATAATSETSVVSAMPRASSEPAHPVAPARHTVIVTRSVSPVEEIQVSPA